MAIAEIVSGPQGQSGALVITLVGSWFGQFMGWLPGTIAVIGGVLAIAWYSVMLWESKTVQDWHAKSSARRKIAKIARLKGEIITAQAQLEALEVRRVAREDAADKVQAATVAAAKVTAAGETATSVAELNASNGSAS